MALAYFSVQLGANLWFSTFHAHAINNLGLSNIQISILFSLTSIPALLIIFSPKFLGRSSPRIVVACLGIMLSVSLTVVSQVQQWLLVALGMLVISTSQILIYTIACALSVEHASGRAHAQKRLARLRSYGPIAVLSASSIVIFVLPLTRYELLFSAVACLLLGSAFYTYKFSNWRPPKERITDIHLSKNLWSYYLMNFLSGSRSVLFKAFVITLLVREFDFDMSGTAWLAMSGSLAGLVGYRMFAMVSSVLSPRVILGAVYTIVGFLFIGFALVKIPEVLVILFIVDSLIFGVSVVTDSTLKVLVKPAELPGQLSTGMAIFHTAGIAVPLLAGAILSSTDNLTIVFFFATGLAWTAAFVSQIHCSIAENFASRDTARSMETT